MSPLALVLQGSYKTLSFGLYDGITLRKSPLIADASASRSLIPELDSFLRNEGVDISQVTFIIVDQGPGAFTSLRVLISIANALALSLQCPLIGVDGIAALAEEVARDYYKKEGSVEGYVFLPILNAYNADFYYGYYVTDGTPDKLVNLTTTRYASLSTIAADLKKLDSRKRKIRLIGNGVRLYYNNVLMHFEQAAIVEPFIDAASLEAIAKIGWREFDDKKHIHKLLPLYLKDQEYLGARID